MAVAGQLAFVAAWIAGGLVQEGYSTATQTVSELFSREADHPWILWIGLAALVPSYLATATLLCRMLGPRARPAAAVFVLASALVLIVLLSPLDCMTNGDPSCAAQVDAGAASAINSRHNAAAVTLQLSLVTTPFLVAFALRGRQIDRRQIEGRVDRRADREVGPRIAAWLVGIGLIGLATVAWVALSGPGSSDYGIAQRTTFGFVNVWVVLIALTALSGFGSRGRVSKA